MDQESKDTADSGQVRGLSGKLGADQPTYWRRDELVNATDRVCAVVWGATIHDLLKRTVRKKLIRREDHASRLFGAEGPLSNFSVLHNLAHAMGLIGDNIRNDLHCVREIRNTFAHNVMMLDSQGKPKKLSFKTNKISDHCRNLRCPDMVARPVGSISAQLTFKRLGWQIPGKRQFWESPRARFEWTCECLAYILSTLAFTTDDGQRCHVEQTHSQEIAALTSDWSVSGAAVDYPQE